MNFPPNRDGVIPEKDAQFAIKANEYITKMRSVNLASGGVATSRKALSEKYEAQNILVEGEDNVFISSQEAKNIKINIKLPEKKTFNTFTIAEKIELGIRVSGYKISALVDGNWILLKDKKSIGYLWAEYFEEVCSDEIEIEIYEFLAPPVIKSFGLHYLDIDPYSETKMSKDAKNIVKEIKYTNEGANIMFGGIYPFNTIAFCGKGFWSYSIEAFDGSKFYEVYEGTKPEENQIIHLDKAIEDAYQIRILAKNRDIYKFNAEVYELE